MKLIEAFVYQHLKLYLNGDISFSKFVEILNENKTKAMEGNEVITKIIGDITQHSHVEIIVSKDIIESALRDFICKDSPELAEGWILSPKYNIADVVFSATKD